MKVIRNYDEFLIFSDDGVVEVLIPAWKEGQPGYPDYDVPWVLKTIPIQVPYKKEEEI